MAGIVFYQKENKKWEWVGQRCGIGAAGAAEVRPVVGEQPALTAGHCPRGDQCPCQRSHKYDDKGFI